MHASGVEWNIGINPNDILCSARIYCLFICLCGIRIFDSGIGGDGAKFMLGISRKVAGQPIEQLEDLGQGMPVGGATHVPYIPWELKLDAVREDRAIFSLSKKPK